MAIHWKAWKWPTNSATYNADSAGGGSVLLLPAPSFGAAHLQSNTAAIPGRHEFDENQELLSHDHLPLPAMYDFNAFVSAFGWPNFLCDEAFSTVARMNRTLRIFTANELPDTRKNPALFWFKKECGKKMSNSDNTNVRNSVYSCEKTSSCLCSRIKPMSPAFCGELSPSLSPDRSSRRATSQAPLR